MAVRGPRINSIVLEKLKELWVIPIWFVIVTVTSMTVGRVLGWLFGLRRSQGYVYTVFPDFATYIQQELCHGCSNVHEL